MSCVFLEVVVGLLALSAVAVFFLRGVGVAARSAVVVVAALAVSVSAIACRC